MTLGRFEACELNLKPNGANVSTSLTVIMKENTDEKMDYPRNTSLPLISLSLSISL